MPRHPVDYEKVEELAEILRSLVARLADLSVALRAFGTCRTPAEVVAVEHRAQMVERFLTVDVAGHA
jgi:hypothetical protein